MNIKARSALVFMALSLVLLVGTLGYIRVSQSEERREEFADRLEDHGLRLAGLLGELETADRRMLNLLDLNSIHRLYDEKVLIFGTDDRLIYSSLDDKVINYSVEQIRTIRQEGELNFQDEEGYDIVGVHYQDKGQDLVVLAAAFDRYGREQLRELDRTLMISLLLGSLFIFGAGYFYIGLIFQPLERLNAAISNIDVDRLDERLPVRGRKDEIDRLALNYNHMLDRLRGSLQLQKAFVDNASHELRTPLARMNAQVEKMLPQVEPTSVVAAELRTLQNDIRMQGRLVESLLLLQRLQANLPAQRQNIRVDEVLFNVLEEVRLLRPKLVARVDLSGEFKGDSQLTVHINELLLRTCFRNLLENAAEYASPKEVDISLVPFIHRLRIVFINDGGNALPADLVFEPFFRNARPGHVKGNGLGLSIVRQVMDDVGGQAWYEHDGRHRFILELPLV